MEIINCIKHYRKMFQLTQDDLAERLYVSRQTISNWETGKSYPDLHSLLMMATLFQVSLDQLVKGDLEIMSKRVTNHDRYIFNRLGSLYALCLAITIFSGVPLIYYLEWGWLLWGVIALLSSVVACRVERLKKAYDIHTYREITAFMEEKQLDEISRIKERAKRPYQSFLWFLGAGLIGALVAWFMIFLLHL